MSLVLFLCCFCVSWGCKRVVHLHVIPPSSLPLQVIKEYAAVDVHVVIAGCSSKYITSDLNIHTWFYSDCSMSACI